MGLGGEIYHPIPTKLNDIPKISQVQCGAKHTVCLARNKMFKTDQLLSWGHNGSGKFHRIFSSFFTYFSLKGQLGHGDFVDQHKPKLVEFFKSKDIKKLKQISCGSSHTLVLTGDNEIYAFGGNDCGQLGTKATEDEVKLVNKPTLIR